MSKISLEGNTKVALTGIFWGVFVAMVDSKKAYFEDVSKIAKKLLKMPKNVATMSPKMVQDFPTGLR